MKKKLLGILGIILLILADQISKSAATEALKDKAPFVIIKNVFQLNYLENRGAAFGILQNKTILFVILTCIVLCGILYIYYKIPNLKRYIPIQIILILLTAGAIGNLIDRIRYNYVVDFLDFNLINFPIFNLADCYVTISAALLMFFFFFYYKEEDLTALTEAIKGKDTAVE